MQTKTVEPLVLVRISCRTSFARAAQLEAAKDMHTINAMSGVLFTDDVASAYVGRKAVASSAPAFVNAANGGRSSAAGAARRLRAKQRPPPAVDDSVAAQYVV